MDRDERLRAKLGWRDLNLLLALEMEPKWPTVGKFWEGSPMRKNWTVKCGPPIETRINTRTRESSRVGQRGWEFESLGGPSVFEMFQPSSLNCRRGVWSEFTITRDLEH